MDTTKNSGVVFVLGAMLLLGLTSCQNRLPTVSLYDDPTRFVRLEIDHIVGGSHSHPTDITTDEMTAVLSGVMIVEPRLQLPSLPFTSKDEEPPRHPAFNAAEISFFAPLVTKGLGTATSEEIVTFYQSTQQTALIKQVTSGGIFIDGDELHIILGNYRSTTNYASDPGIGAAIDGRSAPLQPIAPQETKLDFEPAAAVAPSREGILSRLFRPDRRELVVLFRKLTK
ncbi:MAG: hypothetical protein P0119_02430 [Nitrospira sp.]|nr:hypothetical protein [Nitrospira sp.]